MSTLLHQPWGLLGLDVQLQAAQAGGDSVANTAGLVLVVRNSGAAARLLSIDAVKRCSQERLHPLSGAAAVSVPNDSLRHQLPLGWDLGRFGGLVRVTYDAVTSLEIAAATMGSLHGIGFDAETPIALGATPGAITIVDKQTEPVWSDADADGMLITGNSGRTQLWIRNDGPGTRTIYLHGSVRCSQGFADDEAITVPANRLLISKDIPSTRFGRTVAVTYDATTGLSFAAVRQEAFAG